MPKLNERKENNGRPRKFDDKTLLDVVNQFFFTECLNQPEMMRRHGIFKSLAEYADKLGLSELKEYDIRRNTAVRERIKELQEKTGEIEEPEITGIAFAPLDMNAMANKSKMELLEILRVREGYYGVVHQGAATVMEREMVVVEENRCLKEIVSKLEKEIEALNQKNQRLETEYQKAAEMAKRYKKIIKDNVTPERAKALLDSALRPGVIKDEDLEEMRKIGMQSLAQGPVIATASEFNPVKLFADILDGEQ